MLEYPLLTRSHTGKVRKAADIFVKQIAKRYLRQTACLNFAVEKWNRSRNNQMLWTQKALERTEETASWVHKEGFECRDRWRVKDCHPEGGSKAFTRGKRKRPSKNLAVSAVAWNDAPTAEVAQAALQNLGVSRLNSTLKESSGEQESNNSKGRKDSPSPVLRSQQWCKVRWWQASERNAGAQCEAKVQRPTSKEQTDIEEARTYEEVVADGCQDTHGRGITLIWISQWLLTAFAPSPHSDAYRHIADQHPQEGAAVARISQSDQRGSHGAKQWLKRDCIGKWTHAWSGSWKNGGTEEWTHIKMDSNNADSHGKPERRCISHRCSVMSAVAMLTDWWVIDNGTTALTSFHGVRGCKPGLVYRKFPILCNKTHYLHTAHAYARAHSNMIWEYCPSPSRLWSDRSLFHRRAIERRVTEYPKRSH